MRGLRLLVAGALGTVMLVACGNDNSSPGVQPLPSSIPGASSATSDPTSSVTETTGTIDTSDWRADYTDEELRAFDEALARWNTFERLAEPIWAEGELTDAAERLFRRFSRTAGVFIARLKVYESANIQVRGMATTIWSKPISLELREEGEANVRIRQCIDPTTRQTYQNGEKATGGATTPQIRVLWLSRGAGVASPFYVDRVIDSLGKRPCRRP